MTGHRFNRNYTHSRLKNNSDSTKNIIPLSIIESLGSECTEYYEATKRIYVIDSIKVPPYGKIKYFCA